LNAVLCRYWAVTKVHYIHSRTVRTVGAMIALIWATSIIVSLMPVLGWKDGEFQKRVEVERTCMVSEGMKKSV